MIVDPRQQEDKDKCTAVVLFDLACNVYVNDPITRRERSVAANAWDAPSTPRGQQLIVTTVTALPLSVIYYNLSLKIASAPLFTLSRQPQPPSLVLVDVLI